MPEITLNLYLSGVFAAYMLYSFWGYYANISWCETSDFSTHDAYWVFGFFLCWASWFGIVTSVCMIGSASLGAYLGRKRSVKTISVRNRLARMLRRHFDILLTFTGMLILLFVGKYLGY